MIYQVIEVGITTTTIITTTATTITHTTITTITMTTTTTGKLLTQDDVDECDKIICVTDNHKEHILSKFSFSGSGSGSRSDKVITFGVNVSDPWRKSESVYQECATQLSSLITKLKF